MLSLEKVSKIYGNPDGTSNEAVRDIQVDIREGEFVAFVGPSGCGKSTILKIIAGLTKPTTGSVKLNGKIITKPGKDRGIVFQNFALYPWLTVEQNIVFGPKLRGESEDHIKQIASHYLKMTGMESYRNYFPSELSGGMQQRVAIARTLANNPEILLLDEPMAALDVQTRSQLQEFLAQMLEKEQKTTILVTHDVDEAIYLADRVFVLSTKPGSIKEIVNVTIKRPRRPEIRFEDEFVMLKKHISYIIRSETIKAALQKEHSTDSATLNIGLDAWSGNIPFYIAQDHGIFQKYGLSVKLSSPEKDNERIDAWVKNEVDAMNMSLDTAVLLKEKFPDIEIISILNRSVGADAIVAHKSIRSVKQLINKNIALEKMWVSHFVLLCALSKYGIKSSQMKLIDMKGSDIGGALIAGKVDAAVMWEPWLSKVTESPNYHVLESSTKLPIIYDVLVAKKDVASRKTREFSIMVKGWREAVTFLQDNRDESIQIASSYVGLPRWEIENASEKIDFTPKLNIDMLNQILTKTHHILKENKLISSKHVDYKMINLINEDIKI